MTNSYFTWNDFVEHFGREMRIAGEVYERMVASGLKNYGLCRFDFTYVSDKRENLQRRLTAAGVRIETRMAVVRPRSFTPREHAADLRVRR